MLNESKIANGAIFPKDPGQFVFRRKLAGLTSGIDYKCDFEKGMCKVARKRRSETVAVDPGCCQFCADTIGYYGRDYILPYLREKHPNIFLWVSSRFDENVFGFWRPKVGCLLPREFRSISCLAHRCNATLKKSDIVLLSALLYEKKSYTLYKNKHQKDTIKQFIAQHSATISKVNNIMDVQWQ